MTQNQAPDYALDLFPNKALLFDPKAIGHVDWPNKPELPAELNLELTNFFYDLIGDDDFAPVNQILRSMYYLTGMLSFNLSFFNLAKSAQKKALRGFHLQVDKSFMTLGDIDAVYSQEKSSKLEDFIVTKSQKLLIRLAGMLGVKLNLTTAVNLDIYSPEKFGKIFRVRRPQAILNIEKVTISADEKTNIEKLTGALFDKTLQLASKNNIELDNEVSDLIKNHINEEITRAYTKLKSFKQFFGSAPFEFYERSLTPYLQSMMATACREAGGTAHSTYHGVCQTASEPDVATMANASVFWGVTEAFTDDAKELSKKIPQDIRTYEIRNLEQENHYRQFIKNDAPRKKIKRVAIMGRHIVMRYSAFNTLEFPAYLDIERKMCALLADHGYDVTYKAHPESDWRHFDQYLDPRVKIDWRPFEPVMDEFDALYYHFGASSTVPHALGSHLHVYMLEDGWHDIKIWPSRLQKFYKKYCNMLPGRIGKNGLIEFDEQDILKAFENPIEFDKEKRIHDFFNAREF